jgi:hypothetical protein
MSTPNEAINKPGAVPIEYLEELAADQRRTMHNSVNRLRTSAKQNIQERLDVTRNLRRYFWPASGVAAVIGLVLGYSVTGMFTDR